MNELLTMICAELRNWFVVDKVFRSDFQIHNGHLDLSGVEGAKEGQYIRIIGSTFNDGVFQYPTNNLRDETFDGAVWLLAVPPDVIELAAEVGQWREKYSEASESPYTSESFGGYSYTKASGTGISGASGASWRDIFCQRLNQWRKI